jgi:hypothetical protein
MTEPTAAPADRRVDSWAAMREWRAAIHRARLRPAAALLALRLADHANDNRGFVAWPSQMTLALETCSSTHSHKQPARVDATGNRIQPPDRCPNVTHVWSRLRELAQAGWIDVVEVPTPHRSARYAFTLPRQNTSSQTRQDASSQSRPNRSSQTTHATSTPSRHDRSTDCLTDSPKEGRRDNQTAASDPARADARPVAAHGIDVPVASEYPRAS